MGIIKPEQPNQSHTKITICPELGLAEAIFVMLRRF